MIMEAAQKGLDFIKRQKSPFKVNILRNIVQNFSLGLTFQYQSIYITELGASALELGYVTSLGGLISTIVTMPVGWLADRYGIKRILLVALPLWALGYAIFGAAWSWQMTAIALMVTSFAMNTAFTVCPMICGRSLASVERTTGMQLCDTLSALPRLVAPVVAAFLITLFGGISVEGIRPLYWIEVGGLMVAFFIIYRWFTDPREANEADPPGFMEGLRRIMVEGVMVKRWILLSMTSTFPMYMGIYIPLFARELKGADQFTLGLMDTAFWIMIVLLAIPIGLSADRFGKKKLIMLMTPIYSVSMLLIVYAPNNVTLIVVGLLSSFSMLAGVTQAAISVELVPQELLGSWFGLLGLFRGVVSFVSPLLGGLLWNTYGPAYVFYFLAGSQIVKMLILTTMPEMKAYCP